MKEEQRLREEEISNEVMKRVAERLEEERLKEEKLREEVLRRVEERLEIELMLSQEKLLR